MFRETIPNLAILKCSRRQKLTLLSSTAQPHDGQLRLLVSIATISLQLWLLPKQESKTLFVIVNWMKAIADLTLVTSCTDKNKVCKILDWTGAHKFSNNISIWTDLRRQSLKWRVSGDDALKTPTKIRKPSFSKSSVPSHCQHKRLPRRFQVKGLTPQKTIILLLMRQFEQREHSERTFLLVEEERERPRITNFDA